MYKEYLKTIKQQEKGASIRGKQIRRHFDKFLQKSIHRLLIPKKWTYLEIAKHMLSIMFWFMIYLIGGYLTFVLLLKLVHQHQNKPTTWQMTNMFNITATMTVPNYTLCIQADADLLFGSTKSMGNYTEAVNMFIESSTKKGVFKIDPEAIFAKETYIIVWKYLSMMYEGESLKEMGKNPFDNNEYLDDDEWIALKNVLLPRIVAFNITLDQLKSTFDGKLRKFRGTVDINDYKTCLLQLRDTESRGVQCSSSGQTITYIGTSHLCFKVSDHNFTVFSYGVTILPRLQLADDKTTGLKGRNPLLTIDFSGNWTPPDQSIAKKSKEIIMFKFIDCIIIHITPLPVVKSMADNNGKRVCSNEYTLTECLNECRIQLIQNMCGCLPATLPTHVHDNINKLCTFEKYAKCLKYLGNEDNECKAQCVPNCEKWNYDFSVTLKSDSEREPIVYFDFTSPFYVVFTEIPRWSFVEFVAAIGGALGLYLGLDFIILIRFVSDPIFMLIRRCVASKNTVVSTETHQYQESTGEESCFEKIQDFIKNSITTEDTPSRSMFATYLIEKLLWIVLYTAGGIHTAYLCYGLCQQYAENSPYSRIVLMNNKTIALPTPTLCLHHDGYFLDNLNKTIINRYSTINYTDFLTEYFDKENMTGLTLLDEEEWSLPLIAIASLYLSIMNTAEASGVSAAVDEHFFIGYVDNQWMYSNFFYRFSKSTQNDMIYAMENIFEASLKRLKVSIDDVRLKLGREIAKLYRIKVNFVSADSTTTSLINETKITLFGYNQICFQTLLDNILYSDDSEYIEVSLDTSNLNFTYHTLNPFIMDFHPYLTGWEYRKDEPEVGHIYMILSPRYGKNYSVGISGHYKTISKSSENAECTTGHIKEVCYATCRIRLIQTLCNCTPITWPTLLTSNINMCTLPQYRQCLNYSTVEDSECRENCAEPCERYFFFHEVTEELIGETAYSLKGPANLRIYVKDFSYIFFEDQFEWSFGKFLAALGGMLGLWLGLNIYTIVNFVIVMPISFFVGFCARTKIMQKFLTPIKTYSEMRTGVFTSTPAGQIFCHIFNLDIQKLTKKLTVKWITKKILITLYYLIGIFLTYQMCADTIHNYVTETESSYDLMENDTINLISDPTVCMPHFPNLPPNKMADGSYTEAPIQFFRDLIKNSDSLLLGDMTWPKSFLQTVISFIAFCGKYERGEWRQQVLQSDYDQSKAVSQLQLFEDILTHLDATNTSMNDLMQKCGREVRKANVITVGHQTDNGSYQNITISETTYIDETTICYRLPFNQFNSLREYIEINITLYRPGMEERNFPNVIDQVNVDLLGRAYHLESDSMQFDSLLSMDFGWSESFALKIEAEYNSLKVLNGIQRCSDAISQEGCKKNCRFQAIQQLCSCSPLSLSNSTNGILKRCSMDQYKICLPFTFNASRECMTKCLRPCKRIRFSEERTIFSENVVGLHQANLIIRMSSFQFPVSNESRKGTWSEFQGDIGGALSFWIALDALVFVNMLYVIVRFPFRLYFLFRRFKEERQAVASAT